MHLKSEWSEGRRREQEAKNEQLISTTNKRQSSSYTMTNKRPLSSHSNKAHYITLSVLILTYLFSIVNCSVQHLNNHEPAEKNMMSAKNSLNNYRHANRVRNVSKSTYHRPTNDLTDDLENDLDQTTTTTKSAAPSNSDRSSSSSAMIDAFKMKLLKLLELDKAPEPSEINLNENPIPEPILRELVQLSETERRRRQRNTPHNHHHSASSRVRSRRSLDDVDDDDEDGDDDDELVKDDSDEDNDEQQNVISEKIDEMRFNGSVVQQVTLLPKKFDAHQIEDSEWCSEMLSHSDDQDDVIGGGGGDGEEQIIKSNKNRKFQHYQTRKHHQQQQQTNNGFFTLNCMYFDLEQREFSLYEIRSADLYVKLDLDELNDIFNPNSESPLESAVSNLYIQVNGRLVKKINLITLREEQLDQGETNEGNEEWSTTNYDMDSQESSVFDYANITTLIRETVQQSIDKSPVIRVKIMSRLAGSSLAMKNSTRERHLLRKMFSHVDEQMALHVRFGSIRATSLQETVLSRSRRQAPGRRSYSKQSSHHHHHHQSSKTYRDCSELRKAGYTRANFSCCRETISFSMEQIGWSHWILSPKVIEYKYCRGGCLTGSSPRFENTQIVYKMFELSHSFESSHCCNIYDYEDDIPFIFGTPPSYQTKMVSLNAKNCLCS